MKSEYINYRFQKMLIELESNQKTPDEKKQQRAAANVLRENEKKLISYF